jgi:hypothetical protein
MHGGAARANSPLATGGAARSAQSITKVALACHGPILDHVQSHRLFSSVAEIRPAALPPLNTPSLHILFFVEEIILLILTKSIENFIKIFYLQVIYLL